MIVRSISGLRFTLEELNDTLINNYAFAFHKFLPEGKIVIGRDGRPTGKQIEKTLSVIFSKLGRSVEVIGIVPTPTLQFYVENNNAAGGICITASHNPAD
jgi:phosphomannomutase